MTAETKLAAIASIVITKRAWGTDFLNIASYINSTTAMTTDTKEVGEAFDMFIPEMGA